MGAFSFVARELGPCDISTPIVESFDTLHEAFAYGAALVVYNAHLLRLPQMLTCGLARGQGACRLVGQEGGHHQRIPPQRA